MTATFTFDRDGRLSSPRVWGCGARVVRVGGGAIAAGRVAAEAVAALIVAAGAGRGSSAATRAEGGADANAGAMAGAIAGAADLPNGVPQIPQKAAPGRVSAEHLGQLFVSLISSVIIGAGGRESLAPHPLQNLAPSAFATPNRKW